MQTLAESAAFLKALRSWEILLMTGFSFIGLLFVPCGVLANAVAMVGVSTSIVLYVMAVYFLNSYADYSWDLKSDRLRIVSKIPRATYLRLLVITSILLMVVSFSVQLRLTLLYMCSLCLWGLYYLPPVRLKATFLLGTLVHFIGGVLHFHMGVVGFVDPDVRSVAISVFFALLLCMGHANHEIIDHVSDVVSGIRTTAVRMGADYMGHIRTALAILATQYWLATYLFSEAMTGFEFIVLLIPTIVVMVLSVIPTGVDSNRFQTVSRWVFLMAGMALMLRWVGTCPLQ